MHIKVINIQNLNITSVLIHDIQAFFALKKKQAHKTNTCDFTATLISMHGIWVDY
jgi:hypothetical protein